MTKNPPLVMEIVGSD